jgi:putative ABC transport system permease protein
MDRSGRTIDTHRIRARVWADDLVQDVRYALRGLRRTPGFAAVVVMTLAIAIGMHTAIVSVFNAVALRPLGYPHADRLVWLSTVGAEEDSGVVTGPDFTEWRAQATSFDRMAAYGNVDYTVASPQGATRVRAVGVTADFWDLSGAAPVWGRLPRPDEDESVLLSHGFAQRWFAGDRNLIGRVVTLDGQPVTIVGVLPEPFRFHLPTMGFGGLRPEDVDIYRPMSVSSARRGPIQLVNVVGRLRAGATLARAHAEIEAIRIRTARAHPNPFEDERTLRVTPLHEQLIRGADRALLVLLGAVAFVLLIACANAASLLLARASARQREIAVRLSLGAGRARVLRQLSVESLVLAVLGSVAGLMLAIVGIAMMRRLDPYAIPRLAETTVDVRVLAVLVATVVLTAFVLGLAPAWMLWKIAPHDALQRHGSHASRGGHSARPRRLLVAGEVALALMLVIGAGLMLKSAWRLNAWPPGFEPGRVLTARLELVGPRYGEPRRSIAFVDELLGRLRSAPGVETATISTHGYMLTPALMLEGEPPPTPEELATKAPVMINATSAAMRRVMGFTVVRGRWFADGEPAAVLNESIARRDARGRDPIGRRIQVSDNGPLLTIVGVVADLKYSKLDAPADPEVYVPYTQVDGLFGFTALVRTSSDPLALAPSLRRAVSDIDRTQVPDDVMSLEQALADSIAPRRLNLALLGTFAAAALFLAVIGIYGVMAWSVAQRAHEIGVRMALGARRGHVVRMVVGQGMRLTLAGIVAGVVGALALTPFMEHLLYDVDPADPLTFAVLAGALGATGLLACCLPALRAARVDPIRTLRCE